MGISAAIAIKGYGSCAESAFLGKVECLKLI